MEYPPVIVLIITYRRLDLALQTIRSVKHYLDYPNIGFCIADDGSGDDYIAALWREIGPTYSVSVSNVNRLGVGANMNFGIMTCLELADLWLHLEDDWLLTKPLDLRPHVQLLCEDSEIGMIRLGRLSPGIAGRTYSSANKVWWRLKKGSDTYIFNGNAALRHRRWWDAYGPYDTGFTPGKTELNMCAKFNQTPGPDIVWPSFLSTEDVFVHIGDSQSFKWYMETGGLTAEQAADKFNE